MGAFDQGVVGVDGFVAAFGASGQHLTPGFRASPQQIVRCEGVDVVGRFGVALDAISDSLGDLGGGDPHLFSHPLEGLLLAILDFAVAHGGIDEVTHDAGFRFGVRRNFDPGFAAVDPPERVDDAFSGQFQLPAKIIEEPHFPGIVIAVGPQHVNHGADDFFVFH